MIIDVFNGFIFYNAICLKGGSVLSVELIKYLKFPFTNNLAIEFEDPKYGQINYIHILFV